MWTIDDYLFFWVKKKKSRKRLNSHEEFCWIDTSPNLSIIHISLPRSLSDVHNSYSNLLLDVFFFFLVIVLTNAVEYHLQLPEVPLQSVKEPHGYPGPQQVAPGEMPGAEMHINESDVLVLLVRLCPHGSVEDHPSDESQEIAQRGLDGARP